MSEQDSDSLVDSETQSLPSVDELTRDIETRISQADVLQNSYQRNFRRISAEAQERYEHVKGLREHYSHKSKWSTFLMWVMAGMVVFQCVLLGLVGGGVWDFSKYEWLLPSLLVQNLAQVIGLAIFVVKALFKDVKH